MLSYRRDQAATSGSCVGADLRGTLRNFCGLAVLSASAMLLASCERDPNEIANPVRAGAETITSETPDVGDIGVAVSELNDEPNTYLGKPVIVSGEINDIYGPRVFTIGGEGWFGGELLVASAEPLPTVAGRVENKPLLKGDMILVSGTLRKFVTAEVERDLDFEVPPDLEVEFKDKNVFIANSVDLTPRVGNVMPAEGTAIDRTGAATVPVTDVAVVVTRPVKPELIGRSVDLTGVKVQSVVGDKAFWIGPSANQRLFVVLNEEQTPGTQTEGNVDVNAGQTVTLSGTLKKMPSMAQAQQQWTLTAAEAAPIKNEPIYLHADSVQMTSR